MAILRTVLLLVLAIVGGYIGYYVGLSYVHFDTISGIIGGNNRLVWASEGGFTVIGVIVGTWAYSKVVAYIADLAENLKEMPANDKIALCIGALVGLALACLIYPRS